MKPTYKLTKKDKTVPLTLALSFCLPATVLLIFTFVSLLWGSDYFSFLQTQPFVEYLMVIFYFISFY